MCAVRPCPLAPRGNGIGRPDHTTRRAPTRRVRDFGERYPTCTAHAHAGRRVARTPPLSGQALPPLDVRHVDGSPYGVEWDSFTGIPKGEPEMFTRIFVPLDG